MVNRCMADKMRESVEAEDRSQLELKKSPYSKTGFVGVIKAKNGKFQARIQVPGDGRGGEKKRKQHSLPGLFDTAEDAAVLLASMKRDMVKSVGAIIAPPKFNKEHKSRASKPLQPLQPSSWSYFTHAVPPELLPTAVAVPLASGMMHLPLALGSPLPMQPFASP